VFFRLEPARIAGATVESSTQSESKATGAPTSASAPANFPASASATSKPKRGIIRRLLGWTGWLLLLVVIAIAVARPFLPNVVRWYVNRTLDQSVLYKGRIGDVTLHFWRGAYSIHDVRINKTTGNVPVPFFTGKVVELSVQWSSLLHGRVVGQVEMDNPEVNFVDDPNPDASETGGGGPWLKMLRGLFPFDLNTITIKNASIHFRTYQKATPVDVYLSHLDASVDDLTNIKRSVAPLPTTVTATGLAMDQAQFQFQMKLDPFSYNPTFQLGLRLVGLDITTTNPLIETYGGFNVKRGLFDLVVDVDCKEGEINGYVKPLFRNMIIFNLVQDVKEDNNVVQVFWQAIVGGASAMITNYNRQQLGTLIPFTGQLSGPQIDYLGTIGNVLKNAFIRAYLPRLEEEQKQATQIQFGPASPLTDPISVGDTP
jgi:hypothetical protein